MVIHYGREPVLIQQILIGVEAILEKDLEYTKRHEPYLTTK